MRKILSVLGVLALATGCKVGPNYKRPDVAAPAQYRGAPQADTTSLGDVKWFDVYQDETLRGLIKEALANNFDVLIAAQRVLEAEGQFAATRSGLWPQVNVNGNASIQQGDARFNTVSGIGSVAWELDIWGKLRRASEAARADLLATEEGRKAVLQTLVSQVAGSYFSLRELDDELAFTQASLALRQNSLKLVTARQQGGVATKLEVDQAQSLVATAAGNLALIEKSIAQTENLVSFLLGRNPGPIDRPPAQAAAPAIPAVPAGLPAALLERRPDIRLAEQQLVAANARVGVAKAAFFPSITLTGGGGWQSVELGNLFKNSAWVYGYGGTVDLPIFDAGRRMGNYRSAQARREQLVIGYRQAVVNAFRDVSDSLVGLQKSTEYRAQSEIFVNTLRDQSRLSNLRYTGGITSYLEVLDTERERLSAEEQFARAQLDERLALVQLYKALGGGWQQ